MHQLLSLRNPDGIETKPAKLSKKGQTTRAGRRRLLNRKSLDGRTVTAKVFDQTVAAICADLGGADRLSVIELSLIESFAGNKVVLDDLHTRIVAGAKIDNALISAHAAEINAQVKLAAKLGVERRAALVPDLDTFLAMRRRERGEPTQSEIIK